MNMNDNDNDIYLINYWLWLCYMLHVTCFTTNKNEMKIKHEHEKRLIKELGNTSIAFACRPTRRRGLVHHPLNICPCTAVPDHPDPPCAALRDLSDRGVDEGSRLALPPRHGHPHAGAQCAAWYDFVGVGDGCAAAHGAHVGADGGGTAQHLPVVQKCLDGTAQVRNPS